MKDVLLRKCILTSSNYGNLANKLQKRKTLFQVMLPYYSVIAILNTLIPKYFTISSGTKTSALNYWGIFISITFLVISMQISLAHYPERIESATKVLNELKILISEIQLTTDDDYEEINEKYKEITKNNILVRRRYFYTSCKEYDRNNKGTEPEVYKHFSFSERFFIKFTNALEIALYILVFCLPFFVYIIIFFVL